MNEIYSPYKVVHHTDRLIALRAGRQVNPVHVNLIPSNKCNMRCSFCMFRTEKFPVVHEYDRASMLSLDKMREIISDCIDMGVKCIQIDGGGEPTTHPDLATVLRDIVASPMDLGMLTNGLALKQEHIDMLKYASWVRFSLDAANPITFADVKGVDKKAFDIVIKNIKKMIKCNKKATISINFVVTKRNWCEIIEATKMVRDLGADNIRIAGCGQSEGVAYYDYIMDGVQIKIKEAKKYETKSFKVISTFHERLEDMRSTVQDYEKCPMSQLVTFIGADYGVYLCCTKMYSPEGLIGSIKEQSFKELWESKVKEKIIENLKPSKDCKLVCLYEQRNKFINYMLKDTPEHVNFI
jgi:MoaA/NifB/PqqE/SkfB family radical SAM enzyme